jgi:hypothetical protein
MKSRRLQYGVILTVVVLVSVLATWLVAGPAQAALGNRGIPVYGRLSGPVEDTKTMFVRFYAADGSVNGAEAVPAGKYLLVTDIEWTPDGGTDQAGVLSLEVTVPGTSQSLRLRSTDNATHSMHFSTPLLVLAAGQQISVGNAWFSTHWGYVHISGLLVDSVSFLPVVVAN